MDENPYRSPQVPGEPAGRPLFRPFSAKRVFLALVILLAIAIAWSLIDYAIFWLVRRL